MHVRVNILVIMSYIRSHVKKDGHSKLVSKSFFSRFHEDIPNCLIMICFLVLLLILLRLLNFTVLEDYKLGDSQTKFHLIFYNSIVPLLFGAIDIGVLIVCNSSCLSLSL